MKQSHAASVTSLPQAPQDEATGRVRRYWITMGIRMACFALTVLVTPYGWYTWVFAAAAAILPYVAVVFANAVSPTATETAESPVEQLDASSPAPGPTAPEHTVYTVHERRTVTGGPDDATAGDDEK